MDSVKLVEQFSQQVDKTSDNSVSWIGALDQFSARWQKVIQEANAFGQGESDEIPFAAKLPRDEFHLHLSANLDRVLLKNLRDASPWSAGEMVGFGRVLDSSASAARQYVGSARAQPDQPSGSIGTSRWLCHGGGVDPERCPGLLGLTA